MSRRVLNLCAVACVVGAVAAAHDHWDELRHRNYPPVDLKVLGNFPFGDNCTIADVPARWRALDGQRVSFDGFMYSGTTTGSSVTSFQFVYNLVGSWPHGPPLVQERVFASVPNGRSVAYVFNDMVRVGGTLHVSPEKDPADGRIVSLYRLDVHWVGREPPRAWLPIVAMVEVLLAAAWATGVRIRRIEAHLRRKRRDDRNLCVACGYDLRGISSSRCPECGTEFSDAPGRTESAAPATLR